MSTAGPALVLSGSLALAACSSPAGDQVDAGPAFPGCWASPARLYFHGDQAADRLVGVGDVTGDGRPDELALVRRADDRYALTVADAPAITIELPEAGYLLTVLAASVDDDPHLDLVVASPWDSEVAVFRGPLAGARTWASADARFTADTHGGLANLFGGSFVVIDVDLDGVRDLVIAAPAEQEENCAGQEPPRVFRGPLAGVRTREDADRVLGGPEGQCLGEVSACVAGGFQLEGRLDRCYQYAVPLGDGAAPTACDADR